jgi:hypothetical protein
MARDFSQRLNSSINDTRGGKQSHFRQKFLIALSQALLHPWCLQWQQCKPVPKKQRFETVGQG